LIERGETVSVLVMLDSERPGMPSARPRLRTYVKSWLRSFRPVPVSAEPASFSQRVEIATRSYVARPYAGDVILLRPDESHGDAGWGPLVQGELRIERVPGDHVSMVRGTSVQMLAAKLDRALLAIQHKWAPIHAEQDRGTQAIAG
jgi:thioesterase domain-containing protein